VQRLADLHPKLRLSETVLQQAISFLDQQGAIGSYSQRCPSRGRPRRMLHLSEGYLQEAKDLMPSWQKWLQEAPALESLTINNMHLQAAALAR
jgi:hypothetical protein